MGYIDTEIVSKNPTDILSDLVYDRDRIQAKKAKAAEKPSMLPEKAATPEEKMELLREAQGLVEHLQSELDIFTFPKWNKPTTWEMLPGKELEPGDGVQYNNIICIVAKRLAWWRSDTANILIHEHHNPAKQYRIGDVDYVLGYRGYVRAQRMARNGVEI